MRLSGRGSRPDAEDVGCILTPDGRIAHATAACRSRSVQEQLRVALARVDRARTRRLRRDPLGALELWRGLFSGRWSLVDFFDADGRRFVLARDNEPEVARPRPMPLRMRQVLFYASAGWSNAEMGYVLGISESTVGVHLSAALRWSGLGSRLQCIQVAAAMAAAAADITSAD